jgi:hypothetical protein
VLACDRRHHTAAGAVSRLRSHVSTSDLRRLGVWPGVRREGLRLSPPLTPGQWRHRSRLDLRNALFGIWRVVTCLRHGERRIKVLYCVLLTQAGRR